jgi:ElaB/YqjD/DUF883 family membrane-anchored ribosome-binding protein
MATNTAETHGIKTIDRAGSDAQELLNEATDAVLEGAHRLKEAATETEDSLRKFLEKQPYTAAIIALGIGLVIGYTAHRPDRSFR